MYVRKVKVKGHEYYQLVEAYWEDGKKKTRIIKHLGTNPAVPTGLGTKSEPPTGKAISVGDEARAAEPKHEEPFPVKGATQIPMTIPLGQVIPTPPYIVREYTYTVHPLGDEVHPGYRLRGWRILGSNGAWWPTSQYPKNFVDYQEAQDKLRELWQKGG